MEFEELIHECILEIKHEIEICKQKMRATEIALIELEHISYLAENQKEVRNFLKKQKTLILDNYSLILEQNELIQHFTNINKILILDNIDERKKQIYNLMIFFESRKKFNISTVLMKYYERLK